MSKGKRNSVVRPLSRVRKPRKLIITVLAVAVLGVAAWLVLPAVTTSEVVHDARWVYCLQPTERAALADAAVALGSVPEGSSANGVTINGTPTSLVQWRKDHEDDFTRACDALTALRNVPTTSGTQSGGGILQAILLALLTAALGFASAFRRDQLARRQVDGDALRASAQKYGETAAAYLDGFANFPSTNSPAEMQAARRDLVSRLRAVQHTHPDRRSVAEAVVWLIDNNLEAAGKELDEERDTTTRNVRIGELKRTVESVVEIGIWAANAQVDPGDTATEPALVTTGTGVR